MISGVAGGVGPNAAEAGRRHNEAADVLHGGVFRERDGIDTSIVKASVLDQRDRRFQHRQAPVERGLRDVFRTPPAPALIGEPRDRLGGIATLAWVTGLMRPQQAAAHIGVQCFT